MTELQPASPLDLIGPTSMSKAEYARARGYSDSYVSKLGRQGRLVLDAQGLVLVHATDALIAKVRDPARGGDRTKGDAGDGAAAPGAAAASGPDLTRPRTYEDEARREKAAKAEMAEIALRKERGELVERREVERAAFNLGRAALDGLLAMSDRVTPQIVAMAPGADAPRVFALLDAEVRKLCAKVVEAARAFAPLSVPTPEAPPE